MTTPYSLRINPVWWLKGVRITCDVQNYAGRKRNKSTLKKKHVEIKSTATKRPAHSRISTSNKATSPQSKKIIDNSISDCI